MKALLILILQYFLSTRNQVFWGAILPSIYILLLVYLKIYGVFDNHTTEFWLFSILGIGSLLGIWATGRKNLKRKRRKELSQIRFQDSMK